MTGGATGGRDEYGLGSGRGEGRGTGTGTGTGTGGYGGDDTYGSSGRTTGGGLGMSLTVSILFPMRLLRSGANVQYDRRR